MTDVPHRFACDDLNDKLNDAACDMPWLSQLELLEFYSSLLSGCCSVKGKHVPNDLSLAVPRVTVDSEASRLPPDMIKKARSV